MGRLINHFPSHWKILVRNISSLFGSFLFIYNLRIKNCLIFVSTVCEYEKISKLKKFVRDKFAYKNEGYRRKMLCEVRDTY